MNKRSKLPTGLVWRGNTIHMKKKYRGIEITGSTYTKEVDTAMEVLSAKIKEVHETLTFGVRKKYSFKEAVIEYLERIEEERLYNPNVYKSLRDMKRHLKIALSYVGNEELSSIHDGNKNVRQLIKDRKTAGRKNKTVNDTLDMINRVLKKATRWRDASGNTWLSQVSTLALLDRNVDASVPYPLTWKETERLKEALGKKSISPDMIDFLVNTGVRESEACHFQWEWERVVPDLKTSVFVIPKEFTKNGMPRLVVLNKTAKAVIEKYRGKNAQFVFVHRHGPYKGKRITRVRKDNWLEAWQTAGLPTDTGVKKGVHNLKHTYGRRLSAVGCPWYERKVLLGHKVNDVTELYAPAQIEQLIHWSQKVDNERKELTILTPMRLVK